MTAGVHEYRELDLLCLDAGNVIVFLDHARLAALTGLERERLIVAEGETKRALETGTTLEPRWSRSDRAGFQQWGRVMATILARAGMERARIEGELERLCDEHLRLNLWSAVPEGLVRALAEVRAAGVRVVVVSNSEGRLELLFEQLGIAGSFDAVLDSALVGYEKPDPRIFELALAGLDPARALHVGDTFATDVLGARAANIRAVLVDPHGHYDGRHPDVPRAPSAAHVARSIARAKTG